MGKAADRRRDQILDAAETLFATKGYAHTTVEDLLSTLGIAKGTLYYHFTGKDEILRAIIDRVAERATHQAKAIAQSDASPVEKVIGIFQSARVTDPGDAVLETFHEQAHAEFHIRSLTSMVYALAPILAAVIAEGVAAGVFTSHSPMDDAIFLLVGTFMTTDQGFFPVTPGERAQRMASVIAAVGRVLGVDLAPVIAAMADHPTPHEEVPHVDTADS